jgi:glycopeptide antibiotics resistance protein
MLEAYLVPIEEAAFVSFGVGILLLIPICVLHYWRFGYVRRPRAVTFYAFLFYALSAVFLVSLPLPTITPEFCEVHTVTRQLRLTPFQFVADIMAATDISLRHFNLISILESPVFLQAFFNFLLLMPLGFFLRYYFKVGWKMALAIALATTAMFELSQITGLFWLYPCPYRTFDVDDLILNATGAMLGYYVTPFLARYLPDLQQRHARPAQVSVLRRFVAFAIDWFLANSISRLISVILWSSTTHPFWLDIGIYVVWFITVPYYWRGQTVGKAIVGIRLMRRCHRRVQLQQLGWRYSLLIGIPLLTEVLYQTRSEQQLANQGYVGGGVAITFLGLLVLESSALLGPLLIRQDHRGLHDLLAQTDHQVAKVESAISNMG